jgi:hypothetical protein
VYDASQSANEYKSQRGEKKQKSAARELRNTAAPLMNAEAALSATSRIAGNHAPEAAAASAHNPAWVNGRPAKPTPLVKRIVRAQRNWCRQIPAQVASPSAVSTT